MKTFCECNSFNCNKTIDIPINERKRHMQKGVVVILDGCSPEPTDIIIETHLTEGYRLVKAGGENENEIHQDRRRNLSQ